MLGSIWSRFKGKPSSPTQKVRLLYLYSGIALGAGAFLLADALSKWFTWVQGGKLILSPGVIYTGLVFAVLSLVGSVVLHRLAKRDDDPRPVGFGKAEESEPNTALDDPQDC